MALEHLRGTVLDKIWSNEIDRSPAYKVEIWNPRFVSVQDVVLGHPEHGSLDISGFVSSIDLNQNQVFENDSNAVSSACGLIIEMDKDEGIDLGGRGYVKVDQRLFRDGTPIRIYEGDTRVGRESWAVVFTGVIRGFPGAHTAVRGEKATIRCQAFGRAQAFQKQRIVGQSWPYDTDLGDMAVDLGMIEMGLDRREIRFGTFDYAVKHKSNQLVDISKMEGLFRIMHTVGRKPYFDAHGLLVSHDTSFDKPPVRIYDRSPLIKSIVRSQSLASIKNSVEVIGLNSALTEVVMPERQLAEINVTVGYFDPVFREVIYYSEDRTRRAKNTRVSSVTKAHFGEDAGWQELDEFSGKLTLSTGYAPWVIGSIVLVWAVLSILEYILDYLIDYLVVDVTTYILAARLIVQILKAAAMVALLVAMTVIGRHRLFVYGEPFEFVFEETRAIAVLKGVPVADVQELEVRLSWLDTQARTVNRSEELLRREIAKGQPYQIDMVSDGLIEVDDLIAIRDPRKLPNGKWWIFYITTIRKQIRRGENAGLMALTAWHCKELDDV